MYLTKWPVKRSDSSISDEKAIKAAAEAVKKDQEELKRNTCKRKSNKSKRHYLEPQMKKICIYTR